MAVAFPAMAPHRPRSLHGPSRLSRVSACAMPPPLLAAGDARTTLFTLEGRRALMRGGQCDELLSPLLFSEENHLLRARCRGDAQLQAPPFSLDNLHASISADDVDVLAPMFCEEELQALCAAQAAQQASLQLSGSRSDDRAGEKRRSSPPWPSCISDDDDDENEEASPPPPVKRARTRSRSSRARAIRLQLREWHNTIATRMLRRQFRPPELSHGRTALGCQCRELAVAGDDGPRGCALHQDARQPEDREWMYSAQGRLPLVGGPGEVLVPTLSAGNSKATVLQYARWRRGVRMPTRFYVQRAGPSARSATRRRLDDVMIP